MPEGTTPIFFVVMLIAAITVNVIAYMGGYYDLHFHRSKTKITFSFFLLAFLFYFAGSIAIPLAIPTSIREFIIGLNRFFSHNPFGFLVVLRVTIMILTVIGMMIVLYVVNQKSLSTILKDNTYPEKKSIYSDISQGLLAWLISLPALNVTSLVGVWLVVVVFQQPLQDQLGVDFLKQAATSSPIVVGLSMLYIGVVAPFAEELVFRGALQSWLKTKMPQFNAMIITSLIFAGMHFSTLQGYSNIALFFPLFTLSLYLCIIYEKTRSLASCVTLHITFNLISAIRILFAS